MEPDAEASSKEPNTTNANPCSTKYQNMIYVLFLRLITTTTTDIDLPICPSAFQGTPTYTLREPW